MSDRLRAVIADDEPAARDVVSTLLQAHPNIVVAAQATNGRDAVDVVRREKPDLLFLDIQMPDLDGFRVVADLADDVPPGIIFVTAHDEHALRAFEVHALDYILKPFGRPRFDAAVTRAIERLSALNALSMQKTLASMAVDRLFGEATAGTITPDAGRRLAVRNGSRTILIPLGDIDWVEASDDYARIHTRAESHLISVSMNTLDSSLLSGGSFMRIHRSVIVNLERIRELHRDGDGGGTVVLDSDVRLRVARGRWDALRSKFIGD